MATHEFPFNALPDAPRQALLDALTAKGGPPVLHRSVTGIATRVVGWGLLVAFSGINTAIVLTATFGKPSGMLGGLGFLPVALGTFGVLAGGVMAARAWVSAKTRPYPSGIFLFPLDAVDTRGRNIRVLPLADLGGVQCIHQHTNGIYTGTDFTFRFPGSTLNFRVRSKPGAEALLEAFNENQRQVASVARAKAFDKLVAMDVLGGYRFASDYDLLTATSAGQVITGPRTEAMAEAWWAPWKYVFLATILLGGFLTAAHDLLSDEVSYRRLVAHPAPGTARAYLEHGWLHLDEVRDEIFPLAEIREATDARDVVTLRALRAKYTNTKFAAQIGTSIHQLYAEAAHTFRTTAHPDDPEAVAFVDALLVWAEAHDSPRIEVRYAAPSVEMLAAIDEQLAKDGKKVDGKDVVPVAPYFLPAAVEGREAAVTAELGEAFGRVFDARLIEVHHTGRVEKSVAQAAPDAPTIDIAYFLAPSGYVYDVEGDPRAFVGIVVDFIVTMEVPGQEEPLRFTLEVEPPQTFDVQDDGLTATTANPGTVYDTMATKAYERVGDRLRGTFFGGEPNPLPDPVE